MNTFTYPNSGGTEFYHYDDGLGRLSEINFPGNQDLSLDWNGENQISQLSLDDNGTVISYVLTYSVAGKLTGCTKSVGGIQTDVWQFHYGPFGLEKAIRTTSPTITEDFTTDPYGRILSMTYTENGGSANGEYYFHYDNFGNSVLLTDSSGNRQYAALYDINNGWKTQEWNPNNLVLVNKVGGIHGAITLYDSFVIGSGNPLNIVTTSKMIGVRTGSVYIGKPWDVYTGGSIIDLTVGGGKTINPCFKCPEGEIWWCTCYYNTCTGSAVGGVTSGPKCRPTLSGSIGGVPYNCPLSTSDCGCQPVPR
jgi:hypothetical protein